MSASTSATAHSLHCARRSIAPLTRYALALVALHGCVAQLSVDAGDSGATSDAPSATDAGSDATTRDVSSVAPDAANGADVLNGTDVANGADTVIPTTDAGACDPSLHPPDGSVELASIPSNFDPTPLIWTGDVVPSSGSPDVVGAFRFICNASHEGYDDPIVHPCEPHASHLHEFFGNTLTNAYSTYETLRTTGDSTCTNALNRSSYWIPAMLNGHGQVVRPDYASIYYKRYPENSPLCQQQGSVCVPMPRGLRFVFGWNPNTPDVPTTGYFNCDGPTAEPGHYPDIVTAATHCPNGNRLGAVISAPDCWNGRDLDSPDHRSHLASASYGDWGYLKCPATHPYVIPTFTIGVWYTVDDDLDRSGTWPSSATTWFLSSDSDITPMARPGSTFHADWFGAWDDDIMNRWMTNCVNGLLSCSGGQLGDGSGLKEFAGFTWNANPRVVDPPAGP